MMRDQRSHELRWCSERQALKQSQASRSSSAAKALSILQTLSQSSSQSPEGTPQTEEEKRAELSAFDRKVYAAQVSMETAMTAELKGLGVPFFGTPEHLVISGDRQPTSESSAAGSAITENELLKLRRKMVSHLEELYRD